MAETSQQMEEEDSKDILLLNAVNESDLKAVTRLIKCTDKLDLEMVRYAHDIANAEGNRLIIRLVAGAVTKMEQKKEAVKLSENSSNHSNKNNTELIMNHTELHGKKNGLNIRIFKFKKELEDPDNQIRIVSVGEVNKSKPTKSVLLVGATGSGKTSLISSILTKVWGIALEDNFRIKMEEEETQNKTSAESQTEWITIYKFYHMSGLNIDYNLTIIDTPGIGDTRGFDYDQLMFDRVEKVFEDDKFGVKEINCIALVTTSSANRLTTSQTYIYNGCMNMFGNDLEENIHILTTHSDGSEPAIKDALDAGNVKYNKIHKFNNSVIYYTNDSENAMIKINEMYWQVLSSACSDFLEDLEKIEGKPLAKTVETLKSRRELYSFLEEVQIDILHQIINPKKVKCEEHAMNCNTCSMTCHQPCYGARRCQTCKTCIKEKECSVCKCVYENHVSENFTFNSVFLNMNEENITELVEKFEKIEKHVETIKDVALNPHTTAKTAHIDELIKQNKSIDNTSGKKNISTLEHNKEQEKKLNALNKESQMKKLKHMAALAKKSLPGVKEGLCTIL